jgi:hypothetical protein
MKPAAVAIIHWLETVSMSDRHVHFRSTEFTTEVKTGPDRRKRDDRQRQRPHFGPEPDGRILSGDHHNRPLGRKHHRACRNPPKDTPP